LLAIFAAAEPVLAADTFILATGRRDPRIYAIDFKAALRTPNDRTPNAIVSRSKVQVDRLDGTPLGDPANIVLSEDRRTAYVINHHGAVNNAEFLQHGGRGSVAVMDVKKMLDPRADNTDAALRQSYDSGYFGAVGLLILPDVLLVSHSENWLTEDGSNRISLIDRATGSRVGQIEMALGHPTHACPAFPVPFVSPTPPPVVPFLSPDPQFGCWPNPEFLALGNGSDGKTYLFSGNAGTEDVSVMDLQRALAGVPVVEVAPRVPVQTGPFGIKASPNGKLIAVTARESAKIDFEGNTISIIDVDRARAGAAGAELARVRVGTDDPAGQARPFTVAWTPDGGQIIVAN
jgi:DNA-binding beta-propeller fold protein YncE